MLVGVVVLTWRVIVCAGVPGTDAVSKYLLGMSQLRQCCTGGLASQAATRGCCCCHYCTTCCRGTPVMAASSSNMKVMAIFNLGPPKPCCCSMLGS
jgi:hypothetical protein